MTDLSPQPADDYQMLCCKLIAAAKLFNQAELRLLAAYEERKKPPELVKAYFETEKLLKACVQAMGEPVLLGAEQEAVAAP